MHTHDSPPHFEQKNGTLQDRCVGQEDHSWEETQEVFVDHANETKVHHMPRKEKGGTCQGQVLRGAWLRENHLSREDYGKGTHAPQCSRRVERWLEARCSLLLWGKMVGSEDEGQRISLLGSLQLSFCRDLCAVPAE